MSLRAHIVFPCVAFVLAFAVAGACSDDGGTLDNAGRACEVPDHCYEDVDPMALAGEVLCLDRVPGGYCTHLCQSDADCCAAEGECDDGLPQVCAPFESTGMMMCFLSCEAADVGELGENDYCHEYAHPEFNCRSTGGGSQNRKVCTT